MARPMTTKEMSKYVADLSKPKRRGRPPKVKPADFDVIQDKMIENIGNTIGRVAYETLTASQKPILEEAHEIIFGERESTYGDPGKNLRIIAAYWSVYLDKGITYQDVCNMMVLMKVARLQNTPGHHDSLVDIAGYTALQDRVKHGR